MPERTAIAISAHPDDIEFTMAGTLLLLREAGYRTHYLNVSTGSCGSLVHGAAALRKIRRRDYHPRSAFGADRSCSAGHFDLRRDRPVRHVVVPAAIRRASATNSSGSCRSSLSSMLEQTASA